jgi:hypothetical protein
VSSAYATQGALLPLYGFLEGDVLGILVLAYTGETVQELAARLQQSARVRVAQRANVRVLYKGRELDPNLTLEAAGVEALERFDVVAAGAARHG